MHLGFLRESKGTTILGGSPNGGRAFRGPCRAAQAAAGRAEVGAREKYLDGGFPQGMSCL